MATAAADVCAIRISIDFVAALPLSSVGLFRGVHGAATWEILHVLMWALHASDWSEWLGLCDLAVRPHPSPSQVSFILTLARPAVAAAALDDNNEIG